MSRSQSPNSPGGNSRAAWLFSPPFSPTCCRISLFTGSTRWRAPKEVCVAGLLTGGVALFIAAAPGAELPSLAAPLCLFALLCFANCALISVWEHEVDTSHGQTSLALQYSQGAALGRAVPLVVTGIAAAVYVFQPVSRTLASCTVASSLLLYAVDIAEPRLGRRGARVLADFVLLTPAIPIAVRLFR